MNTTKIHDLLRTYRQHEAFELLIEHMEQSIRDCKRELKDLKRTQSASTSVLDEEIVIAPSGDDNDDDGSNEIVGLPAKKVAKRA